MDNPSIVTLFFYASQMFAKEQPYRNKTQKKLGRGFKYVFISIPTWGHDPVWLIFFRWVETTNQKKTIAQLKSTEGKEGRYVLGGSSHLVSG